MFPPNLAFGIAGSRYRLLNDKNERDGFMCIVCRRHTMSLSTHSTLLIVALRDCRILASGTHINISLENTTFGTTDSVYTRIRGASG